MCRDTNAFVSLHIDKLPPYTLGLIIHIQQPDTTSWKAKELSTTFCYRDYNSTFYGHIEIILRLIVWSLDYLSFAQINDNV
jgi:hypothetical protein